MNSSEVREKVARLFPKMEKLKAKMEQAGVGADVLIQMIQNGQSVEDWLEGREKALQQLSRRALKGSKTAVAT